MLKRFEVENYKGLKDRMIWDLSQTKIYSFCKPLTQNRLSKNSIIYGNNASGKTSLCYALVDITTHLLDVEKDLTPPYMYTYIGNDSTIASFRYVFLFGKKTISYMYSKNNMREMQFESLSINGSEVIRHDFNDESGNFIHISGAENLRTKGLPKFLSVIKYIYNNTIQDGDSVICQLIDFVKGMLFFRSLKETNQYIGFKLGAEKLDNIILRNNKLEDFNKFLNNMGLNYTLVPLSLSSGLTVIGARFDNNKTVQLLDIASSGTRTLMLFYCWLLEFDKLSFLIIDEFDAYYHHDVSTKILEIINSFGNMQSVVTTHNVTLLSTYVTRPDCAYIIDDTGVRNLSSRTSKELRKNHNIEKLYREGAFNE
jgi:hypothetical protein